MSTATLAGHTVTSARVHLPAWGAWWADVTLDVEATLSGAVDLVLADLTLTGKVVSGGVAQGASRYRVAGGAGWARTAPAKGYGNDAGVKLRTVLGDAAAEAGETLDLDTVSASATVGLAFVRPEGPLAQVLELVAREAWYVAEDGVTRLGRRPGAELATPATRTAVDLSRGTVELAAESLAGLVPGVVVDGLEAIDVHHELGDARLRTLVWGAGVSDTSRRLAAQRRLLALLLPDYKFRGVHEFRVVSQEGERVNLQPVRASAGMPSLRRVRVRPGIPGASAKITLGTLVLVTFIDGSPTRPAVVAFEDADAATFEPIEMNLDATTAINLAGGSRGVARVGDPVQLLFPAAMPVTGTVGGAPFVGTITVAQPGVGVIQAGSGKVMAG